jgi:hypothetical protein
MRAFTQQNLSVLSLCRLSLFYSVPPGDFVSLPLLQAFSSQPNLCLLLIQRFNWVRHKEVDKRVASYEAYCGLAHFVAEEGRCHSYICKIQSMSWIPPLSLSFRKMGQIYE